MSSSVAHQTASGSSSALWEARVGHVAWRGSASATTGVPALARTSTVTARSSSAGVTWNAATPSGPGERTSKRRRVGGFGSDSHGDPFPARIRRTRAATWSPRSESAVPSSSSRADTPTTRPWPSTSAPPLWPP
ncbi:MAG: hypothetical protein U0P45_00525 [Acidimicrobiales bacterium]